MVQVIVTLFAVAIFGLLFWVIRKDRKKNAKINARIKLAERFLKKYDIKFNEVYLMRNPKTGNSMYIQLNKIDYRIDYNKNDCIVIVICGKQMMKNKKGVKITDECWTAYAIWEAFFSKDKYEYELIKGLLC